MKKADRVMLLLVITFFAQSALLLSKMLLLIGGPKVSSCQEAIDDLAYQSKLLRSKIVHWSETGEA